MGGHAADCIYLTGRILLLPAPGAAERAHPCARSASHGIFAVGPCFLAPPRKINCRPPLGSPNQPRPSLMPALSAGGGWKGRGLESCPCLSVFDHNTSAPTSSSVGVFAVFAGGLAVDSLEQVLEVVAVVEAILQRDVRDGIGGGQERCLSVLQAHVI